MRIKNILIGKLLFLIIALSCAAQIIDKREDSETMLFNHNSEDRHMPVKAKSDILNNTRNLIFHEDFEELSEDGALPEGWEVKRTLGLNEEPVTIAEWPHWFLNSTQFGFDSYSTYVFDGNGSMAIQWQSQAFTWVISPTISIPENAVDINLNYWVYFLNALWEGEMYYSSYHVKVFSNGNWSLLQSFIGDDNNSNLFEFPEIISLNSFIGEEIRLAFIYEYTNGYPMAIDEIVISENLQTDFGIRALNTSNVFGVLPGDKIDVSATVFLNSETGGQANVSLLINGKAKDMITTRELNSFGDEERITFQWEPLEFGYYTIELLLSPDELSTNNSVSRQIYVDHYINVAEDFENFYMDELGFSHLEFPPAGWHMTSNQWISPTITHQINGAVSVYKTGRWNLPENAMITNAIPFSGDDHWIRFMVKGQNNHVYITPEQYPNAAPFGRQGFSTIQLKYALSQDGPWENIGAPLDFVNIFNDNGEIIQSANAVRMVERDISELDGVYYLGFFHTSTFALNIGGNPFYSYVIIDDIKIGNDPSEVVFNVKKTGGAPQGGAVVQIFDQNENVLRNERTTTQGIVKTPLIEGVYTYKVMKLGYETVWGELLVDEAFIEKQIMMDQSIELYKASFLVSLPNGSPAKDAQIIISSFSGYTDADGRVEVNGLSPGNYNFTAWLGGYNTFSGVLNIVESDVSVNVQLGIWTLVESISEKPNVLVYPNPANHYVTIKSTDKITSVEIFDISGRSMIRENVDNNLYRINLQGFKPGFYVVRVISNKGISVRKFQVIN